MIKIKNKGDMCVLLNAQHSTTSHKTLIQKASTFIGNKLLGQKIYLQFLSFLFSSDDSYPNQNSALSGKTRSPFKLQTPFPQEIIFLGLPGLKRKFGMASTTDNEVAPNTNLYFKEIKIGLPI